MKLDTMKPLLPVLFCITFWGAAPVPPNAPDSCPKACTAEGFVSAMPADWRVWFSPSLTNGSGTEFCQTCTNCEGRVSYNHIGSGPWGIDINNGQHTGGASGSFAFSSNLDSTCDDVTPATIRFSSSLGIGYAYLYCRCAL